MIGSHRTAENIFKLDLLSGYAGGIIALLELREIIDEYKAIDFAIELGDKILLYSESREGYSWKSMGHTDRRNLTGFSHGAAGIGYALLELFHATGYQKYRNAAELAFRYESYWFDPKENNWRDFREMLGYKRDMRQKYFATSWCHGAPGIALSRLRAYEILKDSNYKTEAIIALQTTAKQVYRSLGSGNFSLCHGLTGNAEVLLYGKKVLDGDWTEKFDLPIEIANTGIELYAKRKVSWPCGLTYGEETPNLFLGLAGIGYFYLRMAEPTIPSIVVKF